MMNEIDDFLSFIFDFINDDRFELSKSISDGYRHYTIGIHIEDTKPINTSNVFSYNNISLKIDTQNKYILLNVNMDEVLIENSDLTIKWADICEKHLESQIDAKVNKLINNALSKSDLSREYKIKRIL
jgi:hypothetical protein